MPTTPSSYTPASGKLTSSTLSANDGDSPQSARVTFVFKEQLQSSMKFGKSFAGSGNATVKIGFPYFDENGLVAFSAAREMSEGSAAAATHWAAVSYQLAQQVRARRVLRIVRPPLCGSARAVMRHGCVRWDPLTPPATRPGPPHRPQIPPQTVQVRRTRGGGPGRTRAGGEGGAERGRRALCSVLGRTRRRNGHRCERAPLARRASTRLLIWACWRWLSPSP